MIKMIACINKVNSLGKNNKLLYKLPIDMKRFKALTNDSTVVMGKKTFESIGKPLHNRLNIVITEKPIFKTNNLLEMSLDECLEKINNLDVWIIGGGQIYKQFIDKCDALYLTIVDDHTLGDVFFPEYKNFKKVHKEQYIDNGYNCEFAIFERRI